MYINVDYWSVKFEIGYIWILMKFRWVGLLVCISFFILGINNIVLLFILK